MTGPAVRDLLAAAAPEPTTPFDAHALIGMARRRQQRRRVAVAAPLVAAVALVAGPVIAWPDLPDRPDVARVLGVDDPAAPVLTGRYPAEAVGNGQSPGEPGTEAAELATADVPGGGRLVLVGYRNQEGLLCTGFIGGQGIGLPSSCQGRGGPGDVDGLVFGVFGEQDSAGDFVGTRYAWGSAPADAAYVRFGQATGSLEVPTSTSDDGTYSGRTYFIAVLQPGTTTAGATAHDEEGNVVATRAG